MKPGDIKVGETYVNRGAGRTTRTVIAIGPEHKPSIYWNATGEHPDDVGVLFEISNRIGRAYCLYLKSFAKWAKGPVAK
jgi:hypothetical protein